MTETKGKVPARKETPAKTKAVMIEKPTNEYVKNVYRQSKIFTFVALVFCTGVYFFISYLYRGDAVQTQSRFNSVFQSLLIGAWTWFMFPYIRVTLQMMMYGMTLNERTADFFSKPTESPLIQYVEKKLSEQSAVQKEIFEREILPVIQTWQRIGKQVEEQVPNLIQGLTEMRDAAKKLDQVIEKNEHLAVEAKPAIDALKRIEAKVEEEIRTGFFEDVRSAVDSVRGMSGIPKTEETKPDLGLALSSIRKNKLAVKT